MRRELEDELNKRRQCHAGQKMAGAIPLLEVIEHYRGERRGLPAVARARGQCVSTGRHRLLYRGSGRRGAPGRGTAVAAPGVVVVGKYQGQDPRAPAWVRGGRLRRPVSAPVVRSEHEVSDYLARVGPRWLGVRMIDLVAALVQVRADAAPQSVRLGQARPGG